MQPKFETGDALLIVDVQRDFCPGGGLPVSEGDAVVPALNRWIEAAEAAGIPVYASRDWHPQNHLSFRGAGGEWPAHCVQDTPGAAFHPDLHLPASTRMIAKGVRFDKDQLSAFDDTGLAEALRHEGIQRLWVGGLALDVCVRLSVLDGIRQGFEVRVIEAGSRPIDAAGGQRAVEEMKKAGAKIERASV